MLKILNLHIFGVFKSLKFQFYLRKLLLQLIGHKNLIVMNNLVFEGLIFQDFVLLHSLSKTISQTFSDILHRFEIVLSHRIL